MAGDFNVTIQMITLAIAMLGAVLGLYNAWRNWIQDRVRVRVGVDFGTADANGVWLSPSFGAATPRGEPVIAVNIVNLSSFPITVTHVGFNLIGTRRHLQMITPIFADGETLPVRLESRTACTAIQYVGTLPEKNWRVLNNAYIGTACGLTLKSGRGIFAKHRAASAAGNGNRIG